ncbi:ABC transporter substrate-binding protein [Streptomyces sp. NPDC006856]|uniref:ABC transporter substrate-binding protein n=1 Tax=Streptomyces sp. NPDC006856 TaxID=3364766 RepID=UPI0036BB8883
MGLTVPRPQPEPPRRAPGGPTRRAALRGGAALAATGLVASCGYGSRSPDRAGSGPVELTAGTGPPLSAGTVRVGHFANLTHGTALVGLRRGLFQKELGGTRLRTQVFGAGPSAIEALNAGALDLAWIGPSPTVNSWTRSGGTSLRIVAGAASGGVRLVVNPARIRTAADLRGSRIASPQLGNTQDVALLTYLAEQGYEVDPATGAGEVSVVRTDHKVLPGAYRSGSVDGAWVSEPAAAQLTALGAEVLLDERSRWPGGAFVTTHLVVAQPFLTAHPDVVEALLRGSVAANAAIAAAPQRARADAAAYTELLTGGRLEPAVLDRAWDGIDFLDDPLATTLRAQAAHAVAAGLLKEADLRGVYDLRPLNRVLAAAGRPPVPDAGLGS